MNKDRIDFKQVKKLVRKALRQQAINKLHLMLLNVTNIKDSYVKSQQSFPLHTHTSWVNAKIGNQAFSSLTQLATTHIE